MRKHNVITILAVILMAIGITGLMARSDFLAKDGSGYRVQMFRSMTCAADTVVGTAIDTLAVPANAVEVEIIGSGSSAVFYITDDVTAAWGTTKWIQIPTATRITLPVMEESYIKYRTTGAAGKLFFVWKLL